MTQVASFLLNNGVPCDECLNNTPIPLALEASGDKSHLVAVPFWSTLFGDRLGHCPNTWQIFPHPGTTLHRPSAGLRHLLSSLKADGRQILVPAHCFQASVSPPHTLQAPQDSTGANTSGGTRLYQAFSLIPAQLSAVNERQALPPGVPVPKNRKAPCLPASQPSKCRARIRKAHTRP